MTNPSRWPRRSAKTTSGSQLAETRISLGSAIRRLPAQEREALSLRVNDELLQVEIAERLGCSQMQVSRLLRRAAGRLRDDGAISA